MDFCKLIHIIKEDKEMFDLLVHQFEPLIKKYTKFLYKDEAEDVHAELVAALWETVCNITLYDNEGQVVNYLSKAIKNKYFELYRQSRKLNDNVITVEDGELQEITDVNYSFEDLITKDDMNRLKCKLKGKKKEIYELVFLKQYTDIEASKELKVSRQYVHQVKKLLIEKIKEEVLNIH